MYQVSGGTLASSLFCRRYYMTKGFSLAGSSGCALHTLVYTCSSSINISLHVCTSLFSEGLIRAIEAFRWRGQGAVLYSWWVLLSTGIDL